MLGVLATEEGQGGGDTVPPAWLPEDALPGSCLLLAASTLCTPHLDSQLLPPLHKPCHCWGKNVEVQICHRSRFLICLCMVLHALAWLQVHALMLSPVGLVGHGAGCLGASQSNAGGLPPQTPAQQCPRQPATLGTGCQPTAGWPQLCAAAGPP